METRINLDDHRSPGVRVFSGRLRGARVRTEANLDEVDDRRAIVEVVVPGDVFSVSSSFFLAMFGPSIRRLGENEFRRRYRFIGKDISRAVEDAIRIALST